MNTSYSLLSAWTKQTTQARTHSTLCPGTQSSDNFCLGRQKYSSYVRGCVDAAIIGEFVATLVTAFAVLFCWSYLQKKGHGKVRVFLSLIVFSIITYTIALAAYVVLLTDSALVLDTSKTVIGGFSSLGGAVGFGVVIREWFRRA